MVEYPRVLHDFRMCPHNIDIGSIFHAEGADEQPLCLNRNLWINNNHLR